MCFLKKSNIYLLRIILCHISILGDVEGYLIVTEGFHHDVKPIHISYLHEMRTGHFSFLIH